MKFAWIFIALFCLIGLMAGGWWFYLEATSSDATQQQAQREAQKEALRREALKMAQKNRSAFKKGRRWDIIFSTDGLHLDHCADYAQHLLSLILNRTDAQYGRYRLSPPHTPSTTSKAAIQQVLDRKMDIIVLPSHAAYEQQLKPIRIPICKGLLSYHFIQAQANAASDIDVAALSKKRFRLGSESPWQQVLIDHQLQTGQDQVDYELLHIARHMHEPTRIHPGQLVHIKQAYYFYTHPDATLLHERIQVGLEKCLYDGSFERSFQLHWQKIIQAAALDKRNIITLKNTQLPAKTPTGQSHLWYEITY